MSRLRPAAVPVLIALALAAVPPARAHSFLQHAAPSVGSTAKPAPSEVRIEFTAGVEPAFSAIQVFAPDGGEVDAGGTHAEGGDATLAVALKPLPPGRYQVRWHVVSVDTHRTEGSFAFTVAP